MESMVTDVYANGQLSNKMDKRLQKKMLQWYALHKRNLPWRRTRDPYRIMVAEIMLQQTQVDRVIPKYHAFLKAFPTMRALAAASPAAVLTRWSGLGYNRRAIMLHAAAKQIIAMHHGKMPKNREQLCALPGIGPYTATAILSFAFNQPVPCIDTNIRRVLLHELKLPVSTPQQKFEALAVRIIPKGRSRDWHNALMDYGAMVLTSRATGIRPPTAQSPFHGSRRWYRGQLMKLLIAHKSLSLSSASKLLNAERTWLHALIKEMQREGLIALKETRIALP